MNKLHSNALKIVNNSISQVLPNEAVKKALYEKHFSGNIILISIGKAAFSMAQAATEFLGDAISGGVVITKYNHSNGKLSNLEIFEAGHPLLDENSILATEKVLSYISDLKKDDTVLFLLSGGGSALFEKPLDGVSLDDIHFISDQLLKSGADITEINTVRKHLSAVKGGRFAKLCEPANIYAIVLSDVIGDRLDSIASGPAYPDASTSKDAIEILENYKINIGSHLLPVLNQETPKSVTNCETVITGSVRELCLAASIASKALGYSPLILSTMIDCEAKEAGKFLGAIAKSVVLDNFPLKPPCAIICGGETIVKITGTGRGGRNQELALSAANVIDGYENIVVVAVGSDGTDGPTDAAGAITDGSTKKELLSKGLNIKTVLENNNSYDALKKVNSLIITGATGTNVNDLYFVLCDN